MGCMGCLGLVLVSMVVGMILSNKPESDGQRQERAQSRAEDERQEAERVAAWRKANPKAAKILDDHPEWNEHACEAISERKIFIGMTAEQLRAAWGRPENVNSTIHANSRHEQWVYGTGNYVYVEDGVITSLQTSR